MIKKKQKRNFFGELVAAPPPRRDPALWAYNPRDPVDESRRLKEVAFAAKRLARLDAERRRKRVKTANQGRLS